MRPRLIVGIGGGAFAHDPVGLRFLLSLTGAARPRVCYLPTAGGDALEWIARFYRAFAEFDCDVVDLALFHRTVEDLESFVLAQDLLYVGGGNTANLLAIWRVHGLDLILRRAWEAGVVLSGVSAGMNCWFEGSVTDSFGLERLDPLPDGLGLLPGSACPHYDGEPLRRPTYRELVATGRLAGGFAAEDGAALVFEGTELVEVVASRSDAAGYRVELDAVGVLSERRLGARLLT